MRLSAKPIRVAILHQGFIPQYRVRFYELLNQASGTQYVVFHGAPASNSGWIAARGRSTSPIAGSRTGRCISADG